MLKNERKDANIIDLNIDKSLTVHGLWVIHPNIILFYSFVVIWVVLTNGHAHTDMDWPSGYSLWPYISHITNGTPGKYITGITTGSYVFLLLVCVGPIFVVNRYHKKYTNILLSIYIILGASGAITGISYMFFPFVAGNNMHDILSNLAGILLFAFYTFDMITYGTLFKFLMWFTLLFNLSIFTYYRKGGLCERIEYPNHLFSCVSTEHWSFFIAVLYPNAWYRELETYYNEVKRVHIKNKTIKDIYSKLAYNGKRSL
jgi:hypothetical protein